VIAAQTSRIRRSPVALSPKAAEPVDLEPAPRDVGGSTDVSHRPLLSVVIPTYERPQQLATLLQALSRQHVPRAEFEVVIVDDSGSGAVTGVVQAFADRLDVRLFVERHRGCAGARSVGCAWARGRYLVFADDH